MRSFTLQGAQTNQVTEALRKVQLFSAIEPDKLTVIAATGRMTQYDDGEEILAAGADATEFLVILRGQATVHVATEDGDPIEVALLEVHSCVGEMGLIRGTQRSATVRARGNVLTIAFDNRAFMQMFQLVPGFGLAVCQALADRLHATSSKLPTLSRTLEPPPPEVVDLLPIGVMQRHRALPLRTAGNKLTVGFVDEPDDHSLAAIAQLLPSFELQKVRIPAAFFSSVLASVSATEGWTQDDAPTPSITATSTSPEAEKSSPRLDRILRRLVDEGASDLHISAGHKPRWRVDGEMREIADAPVLGADTVYELIKPILREEEQQRFETTFDLDFAYAIRGVSRFRGSMFSDHHGAGAVFRVIPDKILTSEQLGLPPIVETLCAHHKGLIVVTGPTGSGKSTTLAAMLDAINRSRAEHVITFEDPIEFVHKSQRCLFNQREIGRHSLSFHAALKGALRQDPDIVLLGELRDRETIELALETANTGHLVFGTLHTSTAISTVDRIINSFPSEMSDQIRSALADSLKGVIAQCLCKRVGGGRIAALEIMVVNFAIQNMIRADKTHQIGSLMSTGQAQGNQVLNKELEKLIRERKVEYEEALSKSMDKADLAKRLGREYKPT